MTDLDLLTKIATDVGYIKTNLQEHIIGCESVREKFIRPMWEKYQQDIGASKSRTVGAMLLDRIATIGLAVLAAWAALKGLPK